MTNIMSIHCGRVYLQCCNTNLPTSYAKQCRSRHIPQHYIIICSIFFLQQCSHDIVLWERWVHHCEVHRDLSGMRGMSAMPFLWDMKGWQSHAGAHISPSGYLIKETSVTWYGHCYFSMGKATICHVLFVNKKHNYFKLLNSNKQFEKVNIILHRLYVHDTKKCFPLHKDTIPCSWQ